jgi:hypothetical protein
MGFIDKAFNNRGEGTWLGAGFRNGVNITINGFKINKGFSDALMTESQTTISSSIRGAIESQFWNFTNQVADVESFYGATIVKLKTNPFPGTYAYTWGAFIIGHRVATDISYIDERLTLESSVLIHEYGHYLQTLNFGPIHYIMLGLNSSQYKFENITSAWSEKDASWRGLNFFRNLGYSTKGYGKDDWTEYVDRNYWEPKFPWL